ARQVRRQIARLAPPAAGLAEERGDARVHRERAARAGQLHREPAVAVPPHLEQGRLQLRHRAQRPRAVRRGGAELHALHRILLEPEPGKITFQGHPRVTLEGDFPRLRFQEDSMEGVKLRATAADGARSLGAVAKLEAALLQVGGHRYRRLSVELARARGALTVDARVTPLLGEAGGGWREAGDLAAHLAG